MTLEIDGDFLCYFQAHALQSRGGKLEDLSMVEYTCSILNQLSHFNKRILDGNAGRFIFCFDEGRSWRYAYLESMGIKYKDRDDTKRTLTDFPAYRRFFRKTLTDYGFTVIGRPGYEADDCIHITTDLLQDEEICILSGDTDILQKCSATGKKEVFVLNPFNKDTPLHRTLHQPSKEGQVAKEFDFYDDAPRITFIEGATNAKFIDPAQKLFVKVISGDGTDTIPSAFKHGNGTVGETRADTLYRECGFAHNREEGYVPYPNIDQVRLLYTSQEERMKFIKWVISTTKLKILDKAAIFDQGLYRNAKCILLDDVTYEPEELKATKEVIQAQIDAKSVGTNLHDVFHGTQFDLSKNYNYYKN